MGKNHHQYGVTLDSIEYDITEDSSSFPFNISH